MRGDVRSAPSLLLVDTAALIPVKSFRAAKGRLAGWLSPDERRDLARWMAERVVEAARPMPVFVACDDDEVASWATALGADVLWGPGLGLNGAVDHGVDTIRGKGADHVLISHGDLPLPGHLGDVPRRDQVVIVPDRRRDGTNVLSRPADVELPASYGAASFARHLAAALEAGVPVSVRIDPELAIDVDTVDDCRHPLVAPLLGRLLHRELAS